MEKKLHNQLNCLEYNLSRANTELDYAKESVDEIKQKIVEVTAELKIYRSEK